MIASGNEWRTRDLLGWLLLTLGRYTEALPHLQANLRHFGPGSYRTPTCIILIGFTLGGLGDYRTAVALVAAGQRDHEEQGLVTQDLDRRDLRRFEADARQVLSADAYDAAVRTGETLSPEGAAELALSHKNAEPLKPAAADTAARN